MLYLGGAITMELVLRYAQEDLPGPQTAVTCRVAGDRWKWIALASLSTFGAGGILSVLLRGPLIPVAWGWAYTVGLIGSALCWSFLMWLLVRMTFGAHPALSLRPDPSMPKAEFDQTREALKRAIKRMDRFLRAELFVALAMTAFASLVLQLY